MLLLIGKINSEQYQKIGDIKLFKSMNNLIIFSGNINFKNIKDVEVLAYNNIINANMQIKANSITYRTGSMPFFIEHDHINNKDKHNNLAYFKSWLVHSFWLFKILSKKR